LLEKFIKEKVIPYHKNVDNLEKELMSTYLAERKDGFIQSDIIRRILAIKLRKEDGKGAFIELCGKAKQIYEKYLKETIYSPHAVALECLYQELQLAYYQSDQTLGARKAIRRRFFATNGILQKYLKLLVNKPDAHDIMANFEKILQDRVDWEFQFTLNFFLREEHYTDQPYQDMLREVETFFKKRRENNA
jgi:hypothetical protein